LMKYRKVKLGIGDQLYFPEKINRMRRKNRKCGKKFGWASKAGGLPITKEGSLIGKGKGLIGQSKSGH